MSNPDFFAELPNELVLRIFEEFCLVELLTARRVCRRWRALVPFTEMGETRKEMLKLLDDLQASPWFLKTREWVRVNVLTRTFDRTAYISRLLRQYPSLPESFKIWVLEWPERAVIAGFWPGLTRKHYFPPFSDDMNILEGINWLTYPQVTLMTYMDHLKGVAEHIPGILAWRYKTCSIWIIVDERESLNGKIFSSGLCKSDLEGIMDGGKLVLRHGIDRLDSNWISFLRKVWTMVEAEAENRVKLGMNIWPEDLSGVPVNSSPSAFPDISEMRETPWVRRNDARCQQRLEFLNKNHFHWKRR